jgi:2-dehydro-3-deoxyphosphogluconate aldolase/(4S)-4-hydroxy-2-oxoglutarate aldolase
MTDSRRPAITAEICARRASAIVRTNDRQLAADAMRAAVAGGFRLVEFTLTTPGAYDLIAEFARDERLLVGAGTVLTVEQTRQSVAAGAQFIVSAVMDPEVIAECARLDVPALPGCATPTEMYAAHRLGAEFCKLFPAPHDIPTWVRSVRAPLPALRIFPTNGVHDGNARACLDAGAAGVGFTTPLFDPDLMSKGDFRAIEQRARILLAACTG